jgi:hypothetical protein
VTTLSSPAQSANTKLDGWSSSRPSLLGHKGTLSQSRKLKAERKRQSRIIRIFDDVPTEEAGRAAVPITCPVADQDT